MHIFFRSDVLSAIKNAGCKSPVLTDDDVVGWRGADIDSNDLLDKDLPIMREVLKSPQFYEHKDNRRALRQLEAVEILKKEDPKTLKVKNLETLPEVFRKLIQETPHKWIFMLDQDYQAHLPYFVTCCEYHPPKAERGYYKPASVTLSAEAISRGSEANVTLSFDRDSLDLKTAIAMLTERGALLETEALVQDYETSLAKYKKWAVMTGEQFVGRGSALIFSNEEESKSYWRSNRCQLERDGAPARLVMDDEEDRGEKAPYTTTKFWSGKSGSKSSEEGEESIKLPIHPVARAFNLGTHEFVLTHVDGVEPYQYDVNVGRKLVLPEDHRSLIDALTGSAIERMEDIVKGKATGIIILCSGKPGTGKTLTAEVYSEIAKRPLYTVQCSQLGTSPDDLEKRLAVVLRRATRWRAILLIDEADVYIHERGSDLAQNAIVGVFLRLLEYYGGILFLTTNRETVIDDAILSRCTAHVRYDIPKGSERNDVWKILAEQYGVKIDVKACVEAFPDVSGRNIRQLLRLAKTMEKSGRVSVDRLLWAAKYQDFVVKELGE